MEMRKFEYNGAFLRLDQKGQGIFQQALDLVGKLSSYCSVDDSVIAGDGHRKMLAEGCAAWVILRLM